MDAQAKFEIQSHRLSQVAQIHARWPKRTQLKQSIRVAARSRISIPQGSMTTSSYIVDPAGVQRQSHKRGDTSCKSRRQRFGQALRTVFLQASRAVRHTTGWPQASVDSIQSAANRIITSLHCTRSSQGKKSGSQRQHFRSRCQASTSTSASGPSHFVGLCLALVVFSAAAAGLCLGRCRPYCRPLPWACRPSSRTPPSVVTRALPTWPVPLPWFEFAATVKPVDISLFSDSGRLLLAASRRSLNLFVSLPETETTAWLVQAHKCLL